MLRRFLILSAFLSLSGAACTSGPQPSGAELDFNKALFVSNAVARDLTQNDSKDLYGLLDVGFATKVQDAGQLEKVMEKMVETYGRPLACDYKTSVPGVRVDGTWKRPKRTFWYAVKTTKYPKGKYFLTIEVVRAFSTDNIDVSGFGFLTFKDGVPSELK